MPIIPSRITTNAKYTQNLTMLNKKLCVTFSIFVFDNNFLVIFKNIFIIIKPANRAAKNITIFQKFSVKKFTILSLWMIIISGIFTDFIPNIMVTNDILLNSVFGGILQGVSICLTLFAGATSGGTDFISIYFAEKKGKDIWNTIFLCNCIVLCVFGLLFGWTRALYSIIFQFVTTQILNTLYKRYQKTTLIIITDKPNEIVTCIREITNHDATLFEGIGCYSGNKKNMLYTVVSSEESKLLVKHIKLIDSDSFINILQSKDIKGKFFMRKND
jgi:uncharacterized membrane-anchored protein YitT (DUF2179 family)